MNHKEAVASQAAERYLLHELSPDEAGAFELHYFECADCAHSVESGMQFVENARAVFSERNMVAAPDAKKSAARAPFWSGWLDWARQPSFALAAAAVMAVVALYQGVVAIPGARHLAERAQSAAVLPLIAGSRGEGEESPVPPGVSSLFLSAPLPSDLHFTQYHWVLASEGHTISEETTSAPPKGQLSISVPLRSLHSGIVYELAVYGVLGNGTQDSDRIDTYRFRLRIP